MRIIQPLLNPERFIRASWRLQGSLAMKNAYNPHATKSSNNQEIDGTMSIILDITYRSHHLPATYRLGGRILLERAERKDDDRIHWKRIAMSARDYAMSYTEHLVQIARSHNLRIIGAHADAVLAEPIDNTASASIAASSPPALQNHTVYDYYDDVGHRVSSPRSSSKHQSKHAPKTAP